MEKPSTPKIFAVRKENSILLMLQELKENLIQALKQQVLKIK
jgi:hypothetical protein